MKSKRKIRSDHLAQLVCRELRYLLAIDGHVGGDNYDIMEKRLQAWMNSTGDIKYERPTRNIRP